ncbi:MAG: glycosyl transferase family 1, partial [Candidatus Latescibacteria bacterium]|nr:glycosyl transferase family 1 [Candidatus Latescibacterota bacterium]
MKSVLIVAYYFPPMGLSGVQRTVKFAKYLPRFGWSPTILTVHTVDYLAYDPSLLDDLPDGIPIVRTSSADVLSLLRVIRRPHSRPATVRSGIGLNPPERLRSLLNYISQALLLPDNKVGWFPFALARGRKLLRERRFDAIYATAPP